MFSHEPVEFVARAGQRQPAGQVARDDGARVGVDGVDAAQHAAGEKQAAEGADDGKGDAAS